MQGADLPVVCVRKMSTVQDAIRVNVLTRTSAATEAVQLKRILTVVMSAMKIAARACLQK